MRIKGGKDLWHTFRQRSKRSKLFNVLVRGGRVPDLLVFDISCKKCVDFVMAETLIEKIVI